MIVADYFARELLSRDISKIFVYPGGTIAPLIDACLKVGITYECFKSEQGAGYAALAFSRITQKPQVVLVTSGPGVTNLITPIADAFYDSTPIIVVTGQIGTGDLLVRKEVRQRGFQETPTVEILSPITKKSTCLTSVQVAIDEIHAAFDIAVNGRHGPILLDFPMNIQRTELPQIVESKFINSNQNTSNFESIENFKFLQIRQLMEKSKRTVILLGQGALNSKKFKEIKQLADNLNALVVTSLLGIGSYDTSLENYMGFVGHTGFLSANTAVFESELLVVLGSRLDVRQTGTVVEQFVPYGKVVWIDIDSSELNAPRVKVDVKIHNSVENTIDSLIELTKFTNLDFDKEWQIKIQEIKNKSVEDMDMSNGESIFPKTVLKKLNEIISPKNYIVVTGVGCHQHWASRHLTFTPESKKLLTSGGHGTMGYDLPSAIGAAICEPQKMVVCIVGDGSLLMNIQELASLNERDLNVKIIVMNNRRLGIVSQFQQLNWGNDPTTGDFKEVNFTNISNAFGISAKRLESLESLDNCLNWLVEHNGPGLVEVMIDPRADILPMLLAGQKMNEMHMGYQKK